MLKKAYSCSKFMISVVASVFAATSALGANSLTFNSYSGDTTKYPSSYEPGTEIVLPVPDRYGYLFEGWYNGDENRVVRVGATDEGDLALTAKWTKVNSLTQGADGCIEVGDMYELYGLSYTTLSTSKPSCVRLTKDIVVNKNVLNDDGTLNTQDAPLFYRWNPIKNFQGTFDGQGHTISGLYMEKTANTDEAGLFVQLGSSTNNPTTVKISNLGLEDSYFKAAYHTAGFISTTLQSVTLEISNCYNEATVVSTNGYAAGFIGQFHYLGNLTFINNFNVGHVEGQWNLSGLVAHYGSMVEAHFYNSYNAGSIKYTGMGTSSAKALSGDKASTMTIDNCYYLASTGNKEYGGQAATEEQFANGAVAMALSDGFENYGGAAWGQNVGADPMPVLNGTISGATAKSHAVTFHTYDGDSYQYFNRYVEGFSKLLPVISREGYTFEGWFTNKDFTGSAETSIAVSATSDKEYWAKFSKTYSVTFVLNGGVIPKGSFSFYTSGTGAVLPDSVVRSDGSVFVAWYTDAGFEGKPVKEILATDEGDKTFYAKWFEAKTPSKDTDGCFAIGSAAELYGYAAAVKSKTNSCGKLTDDIVINEGVLKDGELDVEKSAGFIPWIPIKELAASFDGQGHFISGLYVKRPSWNQVGFISNFGSKNEAISFANLTIKDSYFEGLYSMASVIANQGMSTTVSIKNVSSEALIVSVNGNAGGIVGSESGTLDMDSCLFAGKIIANQKNGNSIGGLIGSVVNNNPVTISNCTNEGVVFAARSSIGGLIGNNSGALILKNSRNLGPVEGYSSVGGLLGYNSNPNIVIIQNYNAGPVKGSGSTVGGLVGYFWNAYIMANNYNIGEVSSPTYTGGLFGFVGRSDGDFFVLNNYSMAAVTGGSRIGALCGYVSSGHIVAENNYYLNNSGAAEKSFGTGLDSAAFKDGSLTALLHDYEDSVTVNKFDGLLWVQDSVPVLLTRTVFTIAFNVNGGVMAEPVATYKYGAGVELPVPSREGYTFEGWFTANDFSAPVEPVTKIDASAFGDKVFYAKWKIKTFTVTLKINDSKMGKVTGLENSGVYDYNSLVYFTAVPNEGYEFSNWQDDVRYNEKQFSFHVTQDTVVVANFEKIPESSSSAVESSSAEGSSDSGKSSSSGVKSSSSIKSSSSVKPSSSSSNKDGFVMALAPAFRVEVVGRTVQIAGAKMGASYAVMDMQGRVLKTGRLGGAEASLQMPGAGTYLVRIGSQTQKVHVK